MVKSYFQNRRRGVHTVTESDSDDRFTTYEWKRADNNNLDTLRAMSIQQKFSSRIEHNAKLEINSVWGIRNWRLSYSYHKKSKKIQKKNKRTRYKIPIGSCKIPKGKLERKINKQTTMFGIYFAVSSLHDI